MAGEALGDLLAGAAGRPVNRPALDAAVMQGQAMAGLRSAQTEDALMNAQRMREEQDASDQLESTLGTLKDANGNTMLPPSQARFVALQMKFLHGGAQPALEAVQQAQKNNAFATIATPTAAPDARLAADQALNPGANPAQDVEGQLVPRFAPNSQGGHAVVQQTPVSESVSAQNNANATLRNAEAANPTLFHPNVATTPLAPGMVQTRAQMIANGQAPMPTPYEWARNPKLASDTTQAALQLNPNLSQNLQPQIAATVKDFSGGGKNGQALQGYRTVEAHVALLKEAVQALATNDIPMIDNIMNHAKLMFGSAAPINAQMLPEFLATEGMRALARNNIGALADRQGIEQKLNTLNKNPPQQQEVISAFTKILNGGKKSLEASYNAGTMGMAGHPGTPTFDEVYAGQPFNTNAPPASGGAGGPPAAGGLPSAADIDAELARRAGK